MLPGFGQLIGRDVATLFESPDPQTVFAYTPGIARLDGGRLVATVDVGGPGVAALPGPKGIRWGRPVQGKLYTSDDRGITWVHRVDYPFMMARPIPAGRSVYLLGLAGDLTIMRSDNGAETWTDPVRLTEGEDWHQSACNAWYAHGCVYLVMERRVTFDVTAWQVGELAPVLMRGRVADDLAKRENWSFASELSFRDVMPGVEDDPAIDWFGVPFYAAPYPSGSDAGGGRRCAPIGWLETNVAQIVDPDHIWHDPSGRTFHLLARAHTGSTGYAALAKVVETGTAAGTGEMVTLLETVPSGKKVLYLPCPGGQMRFHVLYDEQTRLYWLLSTQATDSMCRPETLPDDRFGLPNSERRRLQLHFSRNLVDWCFAGLVAAGSLERESRHYASMVIDGDDLLVLSRSGDARATSAHDGNLITLHRVPGFRDLVY